MRISSMIDFRPVVTYFNLVYVNAFSAAVNVKFPYTQMVRFFSGY